MKRCCFDICASIPIILPAFGAGILLTMFLPPVILVGTCAALSVGAGVLCLLPIKN